MTFQVKAELLLNNANWENQLKKTSRQLKGFEKTTKTISGAIKAAWVGVASLGLTAVYDAIVDVTKAAADERKSVALLNGALDKNWHATDKTKQAVADFITKQQNLSGILDDKLRPAFAKIALVVKKPEKAMKAFALAMDISAGTGKDLNVVSQAMAKFLGGNKSALDKLVPGLKDAGDKMGFLQSKYSGMAALAGSNDPFARINVVMEDFKEKLGTAFLPLIERFADWLASDEAQSALDDLAAKVQEFGDWFLSPEGQATFDGWMESLKSLIKLAGDFLGIAGQVADLFNVDKQNAKWTDATSTDAGRNALDFSGQYHDYRTPAQIISQGNSNMYAPTPPTVVVNVNPITGASVTKLLNSEASRRGTSVNRMFTG